MKHLHFGLVLCLTSAAAAQTAIPPSPDRIPIHTHPSDPDLGEYGTWAAGRSYKVRFDDGVSFYPKAHGLPCEHEFRWETAAITVGGLHVDVTRARPRHSEWRFELDYGLATERYDVDSHGVEQSFVIHRRPATPGDIVVAGALSGPLDCPDFEPAHRAFEFKREGATKASVRYGAATAIDARGVRYEMPSRKQDRHLELRIPAAFVATAEFPLLIDPLISAVDPTTSSFADPQSLDAVHDDLRGRTLYVFTEKVSGDIDTWAVLVDDVSGATIGTLFADITTSWDATSAHAATVGGVDEYVIAWRRQSATSTGFIRAHLHDRATVLPIPGTTLFVPHNFATDHDTLPAIGGSCASGGNPYAMLVWQRDPTPDSTGAANSRVWGARIDGLTETLGGIFEISLLSGAQLDQDRPSITRESDGVSSWIVAWQERDLAVTNDAWDILVRRIDANGALQQRAAIADPHSTTRHKFAPVVSGRAGRYLVAYTTAANNGPTSTAFGDLVASQRFDWEDTPGSLPSALQPVRVATSSTHSLSTFSESRNLAYDDETASHWALAYRNVATVDYARLGRTGGVVESGAAFSFVTRSPTVWFMPGEPGFLISAYESAISNWSHGLRRLLYGAAAANPYGGSCAGTIVASNGSALPLPYAGSEFFSLDLHNGLPSAPTALLFSAVQHSVALPWASCFLHVGGPVLAFSGGTSDAAGAFSTQIPLPDSPVVTGDFYWQYLQLAPDLTFRSTAGMHTHIE